jgi:hypothetical protein
MTSSWLVKRKAILECEAIYGHNNATKHDENNSRHEPQKNQGRNGQTSQAQSKGKRKENIEVTIIVIAIVVVTTATATRATTTTAATTTGTTDIRANTAAKADDKTIEGTIAQARRCGAIERTGSRRRRGREREREKIRNRKGSITPTRHPSGCRGYGRKEGRSTINTEVFVPKKVSSCIRVIWCIAHLEINNRYRNLVVRHNKLLQ